MRPPVGRADADGVDFQPALRGVLGGVEDAAFEVLAIGDEDQEFQVVGLAFQRVDGLVDGGGDVGAGTRNGVGVEFAHGGLEGVVVERQRALRGRRRRRRRSGRGGCRAGDRRNRRWRAWRARAVRLHVLGQHALGAIDGEEEVEPVAVLLRQSKKRCGRARATKSRPDGGDEENRFQQPLERGDAAGQRGDEMRGGEKPEGLVAPAAARRSPAARRRSPPASRRAARPARESRDRVCPRVRRSWHPPPAGVGQDDFQAEEKQAGIERPGEIFPDMLEMLDRHLARLELVDFLVDVLQRIVVGGAEELAAADVGDFLQRVVVDIDRDGGVGDAGRTCRAWEIWPRRPSRRRWCKS